MPFQNSGIIVVLMVVAIGLALFARLSAPPEQPAPYDWSTDEET